MELKELTDKTLDIFGVKGVSALPTAIYEAVITNNAAAYKAFKALVGDLSKDWLQMIYQYYIADRKNLGQDYTPKSLAKLAASLSANAQEKIVFDMCAGSGSLTIQKWNANKKLRFICVEYDTSVIPFLLFNLALRGIKATVIQGDALKNEAYKAWRIEGKTGYTCEVECNEAWELTADTAISNPPYNIKWECPADRNFLYGLTPPNGNANYAFILSTLYRVTTRAIFILPQSVLATTDTKESSIREWLIENNYVEAVITCPNKMFEATDIATCILVLNKAKTDNQVTFIRMNNTHNTEEREQRGQYGGKSHTNRVYKKSVNVFTDEHIELVRRTMIQHMDKPELSKTVTTDEILQQGGILSPQKYIDFAERESTHRPYEDIISDINRLTREQSILKLTINETLAKRLGLDIELYKNEQERAAELNKSFEIVGGKYEWRPYITFTKNKNELKFENQDKELFSSLLQIFFPMWRQHMVYINTQINNYLAELRDAMLPDLMSGKINICTAEGGGSNGAI